MMPLTKKPVSQSLVDLINEHGVKTTPKEKYISETHTGQREYSQYDIGSFASEDMQDSRALQQGALAAWGNILASNIGKTVTRTVDGIGFLPSAAYSLTKGLINGEVDDVSSGVASIFDNPVSEYMRKGEEWLNNEFPVYQTKRQEKSYSPLNLGFANSVMDGVSYVASMFAGGSALRAINKFGAKNIGKLFANAVEEGKNLDYVGNTFADAATKVSELGRIDGKLKQAGNALQRDFYDYWGGLVESGAEAAQTREQVYNDLLNQMTIENNGQPVSEQQKELAKQRSEEAGAWNFAANMVTTTLANKVVFGKMFNSKWADDMVAHNKVARENGNYLVKQAKGKTDKFLDLFKGATLTGALTEAGQEGTQFASNDFFVNLFKAPSQEAVWSIDNIGESLGSTLGDMGSKDAVHSMLIGGLIGGGSNALFSRGKDKKILENTQKYINQANNATTQQVITSMAKNIDLSNAMDGAVISGDRVTYETLKNQQIFDWAYSRDQLGKFNDLKSDLTEARGLELDEFKEKYEIEDADFTEEKRKSYIDYLERVANDTKDSASRIMNNYGHKITALQAEAPDMLKYLTMVDVHKKDFINRETELLTKLSPYMNYAELSERVLTDDRIEQIQTQITALEEEFQNSDAGNATTPDELSAKTQRMKDIANQINKLQNVIASSVTEANYKDMMQLEGLNELKKKKAKDHTKYAEYSKDLNDLKNIQIAKEQTINHYNKLVNDVDYAKQVQSRINDANKSQLLKNMFSLNLNQGIVEKTRKNNEGQEEAFTELGFSDAGNEAGEIQDIIKPGDIYSLNREFTTKDSKTKQYRNFERYSPYEVRDTRVDMNGSVPVGMVEVQSADGRITEMSVNEFRRSLRPIQDGQRNYYDYKYRLPKEEERFYKMYKKNAIKYQLPDGNTVIGMMGFNERKPGLVLKYYDTEGNLKSTLFNPTEYKRGQGGYLEILSEKDTTAYKLKQGTVNYIVELNAQIEGSTKAKDTTQKHLDRMTRKMSDLNDNQTDTRKAVQSLIDQYSKFIDKLEEEVEIKRETLNRLNELNSVPFEVTQDVYPKEINDAIENSLNYRNAALSLTVEANGKTPKVIRDEKLRDLMLIEVEGETQKTSAAKAQLKLLKQQYVDGVKSKLTGIDTPVAKDALTLLNDANINPRLDDQFVLAVQAGEELDLNLPSDAITGLANKLSETIAEAKSQIQDINNEYNDRIIEKLGANPNDVRDEFARYRQAEFAAITKFGILINTTNYWPRREFSKARKIEEVEYDLSFDFDKVTRRPEFILKSTVAGNNPHKKAFQDVLPLYDAGQLSVRVIPESEYGKYQLKANGEIEDGLTIVNPIYVALTDKSGKDIEVKGINGVLTPITSLPLLTLTDTRGARFRDGEGVTNLSKINDSFNSISNTQNYIEELDKVKKELLSDTSMDANDLLYVTKSAQYLQDLYSLREKAKVGGVTLEVNGKSNGIAKLGENSGKYISKEGKIVIADSPLTYMGDQQFETKSGRAYYMDESKGLFFPVVVNRLGNTKFTYGSVEKSVVDNIIDAGKFIRASAKGQAYFTAAKGRKDQKLLSDALVEVNNDLSLYVYQNRNESNPDAVFTYDYNGTDVIFRVGRNSYNLNTQEEEIRDALRKRLFNIDKKSLDQKRWLSQFRVIDSSDINSEVHLAYKAEVDYNDLVRDKFGLQSNISTFESGYVTFSGATSVVPRNELIQAAPPLQVDDDFDPATYAVAGGNASNLSSLLDPTPSPSAPVDVQATTGLAGRIRPSVNPTNPSLAKTTPTKTTPPTGSGKSFKSRYMRVNSTNIRERMSWQEQQLAERLFKEKYDVDYQLVNQLIDNDAFGKVTAAAEVLISDQAPKGVVRHEEFHLVSQHIMPRDMLYSMYETKRQEKGFEDKNNDQLEEALAEGYDQYSQDSASITGKLKEIFDAFTALIRKLIGLKPRIKDVYREIKRGAYYGMPVYKGTTSYKMRKYDGEERNELEQIPEQERLQAYRAGIYKFIMHMRSALAESIPKRPEEEALLERNDLSQIEQDDLAYYDQERQLRALTRLITNPAERRLVLETRNPDGLSNFDIILQNAWYDYLSNSPSEIAAKFKTAVGFTDNYNEELYEQSLDEFFNVVTKELNISFPEAEDIDEYETDRNVVKKGDTEVDFFQESQTALKLMAYTQLNNDGETPINVSKLTKLYFEKLSNKTNDNDFFQSLRTLGNDSSIAGSYGSEYQRAVNYLAEIMGLYNSEPSTSDIYMQQLMYGIFNKQDVSYQVMKIVDAENGAGLNYYFVDQSKEKNKEQIEKEFISGLKLNFESIRSHELFAPYRDAVTAVKNNSKDRKAISDLRLIDERVKQLVFEQLTGRPLTSDIRNEYKNIDTILNHFIMFNGSANDYIKNNGGNINKFVEIMQGQAQTKIFSITNARKNPQFSLQNPASIHFALKEYQDNLTPEEASEIKLGQFINLNGTQYTANSGREGQETKYAAASELLESDLLAMYYTAMTNSTTPMVPYIFNGDKSSIGGFKVTGSFLDKGTTGQLVHQNIQRRIFNKELSDLAAIIRLNNRIGFAAKQLPFYSFLKNTNENLYKNIIEDVTRAAKSDNIQAALESINNTYSDSVLVEAAKFFDNKATQIKERFEKVGFKDNQLKDDDLKFFARAFAIANYEQTKLTGSLNFYKDPAKRLYAWTSAKSSINTSDQFLSWYNDRYNEGKPKITKTYNALVVDDIADFTDSPLWKGNNPADAQAWITLDTARFMLFGSGKFNQRLDDLFYAIEQIDEKTNPTQQDYIELNEHVQELGEQLNVLKPQAFGNQDIDGVQVPTFYKFSVFPITKTMARGKNLEKMLNVMEQNNINILMVDSANKVGRVKDGGLPMYDKEGNFVLDSQDIEPRIQTTSWKGLGLQVDMPNKHNTVSAGTQARKLITENLDYIGDATYLINGQSKSASEVKSIHENLVKEKLRQDEAKLRAELGVNEDYEVTEENLKQVKKKLHKLANLSASTSFGLMQDIQDLGSFDMSTNKAKLQGIMNSLLSKNVIKQKITGDAKAMVSSVGFEKRNNSIQKDNRLKFYEDVDGKRYMEVYLPYSQMREYKNFTYFDNESKMFKFKEPKAGEEKMYENVRSLIGYRIPTQAQASIENIRIAGFMPAAYGNAIVVPFELTSKAGSDFDIDKLNLYMPKFDNSGKYDVDHIDNQLLRFYRDLMDNAAYYPLFVKSIDGGSLERVAKKVEKIKGIDKGDNTNYYNFFDPLYLTGRRRSFISAKETLGAAALATVHHAESQKHNLRWKERIQLGSGFVTNRLDKTTNSLGELLESFVKNIVANDNTVRFDRVFMLNRDGKETKEYISDKLSEFVNAFVDAAKDDYITSANVDLETIGVGMLMTRAGVPEDLVLNFLAQPGIVEYTRLMKEAKSNTRVTQDRKYINKMFVGNANKANVDLDSMLSNLTEPAMSTNQMNYVDMYKQLNQYAQQLTDLQQITTFDTKATDKMIESNEINLMKYDNYMKNSAKYWTGISSMTDASESFQAAMREVARKADKFNSEFFNIKYLYNSGITFNGRSIASPTLESAVREIQNDFGGNADKVYKISKLNNYFITWLAQKQAAKSLSNGQDELVGKVGKAIARLNTYDGNNAFVRGLRVIDKRIYSHSSAALTADELNERQAAFQELMYEDLEFAKDLIYAGIATHGFVNNPFSYMNQIPGSTILDVIGVDKNSPLLSIYTSLTKEEINDGVNKAKEFAKRGYEDTISNFVLETPKRASLKLDESYTC
jgi:hypothetical protein